MAQKGDKIPKARTIEDVEEALMEEIEIVKEQNEEILQKLEDIWTEVTRGEGFNSEL